MIHINESNASEPSSHCSMTFSAEASELRLPPGHWPEELTTSLGNGLNFHLVALTAGSALYEQIAGCISLRIYND